MGVDSNIDSGGKCGMKNVSATLPLPLALSFLLLGCDKQKQSSLQLPTSDAGLRAILGVKALDAVFTLPPGEDYYGIGTQVYENGKMTNESISVWGSVKG